LDPKGLEGRGVGCPWDGEDEKEEKDGDMVVEKEDQIKKE